MGGSGAPAAMAAQALGFMRRFQVPGLSIAIGLGGDLVHAEAFGVADRATGERLTPAHRFRIASVTKPITATAIFTLIEQGRLGLEEPVFGPGGVLGTRFGPLPLNSPVRQVTVEHLLTHTAGGWSNDRHDPMFLRPGEPRERVIATTVRNVRLAHRPGTRFAYSNFGYCVLGRVIEQRSGRSYEDFTRDAVLRPRGAGGMTIGDLGSPGPAAPAARHHGQGGDDPDATDLRRLDSHGGWVASPADIVRFAMHLGGGPGEPPLPRPETVRRMTTPSAVAPTYGRGWYVSAAGECWHDGSLPGAVAILLRAPGGLCWAACANTRDPARAMVGEIVDLMRATVTEAGVFAE